MFRRILFFLKKVFFLLPSRLRIYIKAYFRLGYFVNIHSPRTFNEKIGYRKIKFANSLFSKYSDKVYAKKLVRGIIGSTYINESIFVGTLITEMNIRQLLASYGDIVVKLNHNSGAVYFLGPDSSSREIKIVCNEIDSQIKIDYGKKSGERWYSDILPMVLVERNLLTKHHVDSLDDFKFHVFNQSSGNDPIIIVQIDFDRFSNHHRSFFDINFKWLPFSCKYPCIVTKYDPPLNYGEMVDIAKKLAEPFSYARVDLYNVNGRIYFGELTFAHGSGAERFSDKSYDLWMGRHWSQDPAI